MTAYLSFEYLKLSKRWMPRVVVALTFGIVVAFFWGTASKIDSNFPNVLFPRALPASLLAATFVAPLLWPVLGGSWPGNEYGWGSIRLILSRRPYRIEHVISSLIALLATIGIALLGVMIVGGLTGIVVSILTGHPVFVSGGLTGTFGLTVAKAFLVAWYAAAFALILAFAAGTIFRSAAAGIGVGVGATLLQLIGSDILFNAGGIWKTIALHLPIRYAQDLAANVAAPVFVHGSGLARVNPADPSVGQSILALGLMMAVLLAATFIAVRNRDITA